MSGLYYIICERVAAVVSIPAEFTSEQWGAFQRAFEAHAEPDHIKRRYVYCACYKLYPSQSHNGVFWDEELCGPRGMAFLILRRKENSDTEVSTCKRHLRASRDAIRLRVTNPKTWACDWASGVISSLEKTCC